VVTELEEHIRRRFRIWSGRNWIQVRHQLTSLRRTGSSRSLNQQSAGAGAGLRRKRFFLEDLAVISAGALRIGDSGGRIPTAASALRMKTGHPNDTSRRLPVAMREILQQEMELALR